MKPLLNLRSFEWNDGNREKNWIKHRVSRSECEQVFFHQPLVACDEEHSQTEDRYYLLGTTDLGRRLFVVFTTRNQRIRVISARDMSRRERGIFQHAEDQDSKV